MRTSHEHQEPALTHPLAYVRAERGWTHQDLVDVIARRVGNMATRREKAWRWEHWGVVPDEASQQALAAELGVPSESVGRLGWPGWLPVGNRPDVAIPWTVHASLTVLHQTAGAALLDRRAFLTLSAGTLVTAAEQWVTLDPIHVDAALKGGRVDAALLTGIEQRLPSIRQTQFALGGGSVRNMADAELGLVSELLTRGAYTQELAQRMFSVAAELGRIAGWSSLETGLHASAERYLLAALRASHSAGNRAIGANILKCMSLQLIDAGRPREALAVAGAAREGAQAPPRVVAMMAVREARAHAVLGQGLACEKVLVQAEKAMTRADDVGAPDWAAYFDRAEYCAQVASCYLLLRRYQTADHWLEQSLRSQPLERGVDRATYLIWRAEALLQLGDLDQACSLVAQAVPSIASARSARNRRRIADVQHHLKPHKHHRAVIELDEHLRVLSA